jgi:hypothetical protein
MKDFFRKILAPIDTRLVSEADVLQAAFKSLDRRPSSPRRVPPGELNKHGLQRWVRVEGPTTNPTEDHLVPRSSKALIQLRALSRRTHITPPRPRPLKKLEVAAKDGLGLLQKHKTHKLMRSHSSSSNGSPFLSGTPFLTSGQISNARSSLMSGRGNVTITISYTGRAFHNSRSICPSENEALLPVAEHPREIVGVYTLRKRMIANGSILHVESYYHDMSGDRAIIYTNAAADAKFAEIASPKIPLNWNCHPQRISPRSVRDDSKTDWRRWGYGEDGV